MTRRSKRSISLTAGTRRSKRKKAGQLNDSRIYGNDFGILPSDCSKVAASAIPGRIPLGFVCGYPLSGGELYGGSMFIKSAANDTLQGSAIQKVNENWGTDFRSWNGHETIGIPVCKKKYAPFNFRTVTMENGEIKVKVTRMYGCVCHSQLRENIIRLHGPRDGWEPFGQWSMKKALGVAKQFAQKLNQDRYDDNLCIPCSSSVSSSDDEQETSTSSRSSSPTVSLGLKNLCQNGVCAWKVRDKVDDIAAEISEADINRAKRKLISMKKSQLD